MDRAGLPELIGTADGKVEPFEPERITRSLFAATEQLGSPNAFLAQELTDGVLHFLAADPVGSPISSDQIAEMVAKIVRELGHPELARRYEERHARTESAGAIRGTKDAAWPGWFDPTRSPFELALAAAASPLEAFSLTHLYPPALASAHAEGLIRLTALTTPLELAGMATAVPPGSVLDAVTSARQLAGSFMAIDGPEYDLAKESGDPAKIAGDFVCNVRNSARSCGVRPILNLNVLSPPPRVAEALGPLFGSDAAVDPVRRDRVARELAEQARESDLVIWWHAAADSADFPQLYAKLQSKWASERIELVFDRPGQPVRLGPGLDRQTPATLLIIGVNLARLVEMMGGPPVDPERFLSKVRSLARFAKTAGHAKQDFLRRHGRPALREAFLLDRAGLVLVPLGLADAARAGTRPPSEFARDIVKNLRHAAENDRPRRLPVRVDAVPDMPGWDSVGEPGLSFRHQVRAASPAHSAAGGGRLVLHPPPEGPDPADVEDSLRLAARSGICRLCFRPVSPVQAGQEFAKE